MRQLAFLLLSCSLTMLVVGINLDTMSTACLAFELGVALFFMWQWRQRVKAAELEAKNVSSDAPIERPNDSGPHHIPADVSQ